MYTVNNLRILFWEFVKILFWEIELILMGNRSLESEVVNWVNNPGYF